MNLTRTPCLRSRFHFDVRTRNNTGNRLLHTTAPRRADVTLTIDGKEVTVPQGTALIQACVSLAFGSKGIDPLSD
jgi:NADH dehydrogenase (ubiquinone) Fe-S protein 1